MAGLDTLQDSSAGGRARTYALPLLVVMLAACEAGLLGLHGDGWAFLLGEGFAAAFVWTLRRGES